MKPIRAFQSGGGWRSRCFVAIIALALVIGYGLTPADQMIAEASINGGGIGTALTVAVVGPGDSGDLAVRPRLQTDTETLDEGAPPAPTTSPPPTTSSLPSQADDVETLDQGSPPPPVTVAPPVGSVAGTYVAPAPAASSSPTYAAPVESAHAGPVIPPGFGTGHVHVAAGHPEFPVGLVSCHVGTITGRAYVGVDCPNGDSVVGFAPSLNDFPFILNPDFPFEGDEGFLIDAARSEAAAADAGQNNVDVLASMPDGSSDLSTAPPQIGVSGSSSTQFTQTSRSSEPTVETNSTQGASKQGNNSKQSSSGTSSTRMQHTNQNNESGTSRTYSLAKRQKVHEHGKDQQHRGSAKGKSRHDNGGNAKQSHHQKGKGDQKHKNNQQGKSHHKGKSGKKK